LLVGLGLEVLTRSLIPLSTNGIEYGF
jgi:hypothetical protein